MDSSDFVIFNSQIIGQYMQKPNCANWCIKFEYIMC